MTKHGLFRLVLAAVGLISLLGAAPHSAATRAGSHSATILAGAASEIDWP